MDINRALQFADEVLEDPLRSRFKSFWAGFACQKEVIQTHDFCRLTGVVDYVCAPTLGITPYWFNPGAGFSQQDDARLLDIAFLEVTPCLLTLCPGDIVTCHGKAKIYDSKLSFDSTTVVCRWPTLHPAMPWNVIHWFSGGFMGWSKAFAWLAKKEPDCAISQQVFVDSNPQVMDCWAKDTGRSYVHGPISPDAKWNPSPTIGVCSEVADVSLGRLATFQSNSIQTMSPPCVSWSKGGKNYGLNSKAGFAFFEAIEQVAITQPLIVVAECADETPKHPHFELLSATFSLLGYKRAWQQIVPTHQLTHAFRTRWLAVWLRQDIPGKCIDAVFELRHSHFAPWHSEGNKLYVPPQILRQLILDEQLCQIYGNPEFLPPKKRVKYSCQAQVFEIRQASLTDPLPTLCASYTRQHCLDEQHIREKGIFATLQVIDDQVSFLDPLRFIALLGTTGKVTIPLNVGDAFHILGNSIGLPHALLACAVAFSSVLDFDWFPSRLVAECWQDRLQFSNSVVCIEDQFVVVRPLLDFCLNPPIHIPSGDGDMELFITSPTSPTRHTGRVRSSMSIIDFLDLILGVPVYLHAIVTIAAGPMKAVHDQCLSRLAAQHNTWKIVIDTLVIAVVDMSQLEPVLISPTAVFHVEESQASNSMIISVWSMPNHEYFEHDQLCQVLTLCEHEQRKNASSSSLPICGFVLFFPIGSTVGVIAEGADFWPQVQNIIGPKCDVDNDRLYSAPTTTLLGQQLALFVYKSSVASNSVVVILENIPLGSLRCAESPTMITTDVQILVDSVPHFVEQVNGNPMRQGDSIALQNADVLSIRPKSQVDNLIRCGGHHETEPAPVLSPNASFLQRCEYAADTHGWIATDELIHIVSCISDQTPIPVPHFEVMRWHGEASDLESLLLGEPEFPVNITTWLFVLVQSHWMLCIVNCESTSAHVVVQGCSNVHCRPLVAAIARVLDLASSRVMVSFIHVDIVPHMCGWTFVHQFAARSTFAPQQQVTPSDEIHPHFLETIEDVLAISREEWRRAGAPVTLCNFAHESRRLFLRFRAKHADPAELPQGFQPRRHISQPVVQPPRSGGDPILGRLQHMWQQPSWLPSDVCDDLLGALREAMPHTLFGPPLQWNSHHESLEVFNNFSCNVLPYSHAFFFILWDTHWVTCEIHKAATVWITIQAPNEYRQYSGSLIRALVEWLSIDMMQLHTTFLHHSTLPNVCGWSCLFDLFNRFGVACPVPTVEQHLLLVQHRHAETINAIRALALRQWQHDFIPLALITFAQSALVSSLVKILEGRGVQQYASGGAPETKPMQPDSSTNDQDSPQKLDPWIKRDPWQPKSKQQTRWEDLQLASDHPFVTDQQKKIPQTHRLQVTATTGGLVLTTKSHLQELAHVRCKQPLGAILPAVDSSMKSLDVSSLGPYEVVLHDPNAQVSYKRLVSLIVFSGNISFHLHSPAHTFKTAAISEIVIEIDNRLLPKDEFEHLKTSPSTNIKKLFAEQLPTCATQTTFYSFRHNFHPSGGKQDMQLQCIAKIPTSHRRQVLEISGKAGFLTRDYLEKGVQSADTTVIPRFWPVTLRDLRELSITLQAVKGHAGVVLTRRGLAARSWNESIAKARQTLIPDDNRLCQENLHIVPKVTFEAAGWPAGTTPQDVVTAVHKATSQPPIPMRTFRLGGVNVWVLAFQSPPETKHRQFTVQINEKIHEILLTEAPSQPLGKGSSKGKGKKKESEPIPKTSQSILPSSDRQRLDALEAKFDNLGRQVSTIEDKQAAIESKIDEKFDTINDNLRQLLQQTNPRQREQTQGESPPAKFSKN